MLNILILKKLYKFLFTMVNITALIIVPYEDLPKHWQINTFKKKHMYDYDEIFQQLHPDVILILVMVVSFVIHCSYKIIFFFSNYQSKFTTSDVSLYFILKNAPLLLKLVQSFMLLKWNINPRILPNTPIEQLLEWFWHLITGLVFFIFLLPLLYGFYTPVERIPYLLEWILYLAYSILPPLLPVILMYIFFNTRDRF